VGDGDVDTQELRLSERHRAVVDRFVTACRADDQVIAALLGGSYARGTADSSSDLDLGVITVDNAYAGFYAGRAAFIRRLGEPLFLEEFNPDGCHPTFFILSDGVEGELAFGREGAFRQIHGGPHVVLLDKTGILAGVQFPEDHPSPSDQVERLRRLVYWFWHDLSRHILTALERDQLWTAIGALEEMRRACVDLARLAANFTAAAEGYEQVERVLPPERLASLETTFCPPERDALLRAVWAIVDFYREVAPPLGRAQGIRYPTTLEQLVCRRLGDLSGTAPRG
jgi:predicted nucleotidyltransferase